MNVNEANEGWGMLSKTKFLIHHICVPGPEENPFFGIFQSNKHYSE